MDWTDRLRPPVGTVLVKSAIAILRVAAVSPFIVSGLIAGWMIVVTTR